ncbi:MAG: hypothetical protein OXR62_02325 [Ahrensia sp.]|nr:hypothetical protein [Ahrensia sp.]
MQMPLIALPVLSERKLNGLLFFKAGLSWTSTMPDTPDEVVATVFLDATVNAGFERALSTQADVVNMDEKAFAADIKEKMVAIGAPIKDAELLVLQLEYFDQAALRSPTLDIDDSE